MDKSLRDGVIAVSIADGRRVTVSTDGHADVSSYGIAVAGDNGYAQASLAGVALVGRHGWAEADQSGRAFADADGISDVAKDGVAYAGCRGQASAGENGVVCIEWIDARGRLRLAVGYVGEDGIEPDTRYQVDSEGKLVPA